MTQSKTTIIYCDAEKGNGHSCEATYGEQIGLSTAKQVREIAAREGWTNDGAEDYCPKHSGNEGEEA